MNTILVTFYFQIQKAIRYYPDGSVWEKNGMLGLLPGGRLVSFTGIASWKLRDGKLAVRWMKRSELELYQELQRKTS